MQQKNLLFILLPIFSAPLQLYGLQILQTNFTLIFLVVLSVFSVNSELLVLVTSKSLSFPTATTFYR